MKLHNKNKTIMRGKEGAPKPEKTIDIFRKTYYFILFFFLGYLIYYFVFRSFIVRGEGFVVFDIIKIESPVNGEVVDLNISNIIKKNQLLCKIKERIKNNIPTSTTIINKVSQTKLKLLDLETQYKIKYKEYLILKKQLEKLTALRSLELYNPNETSYQNLKNKLNQIRLNLEILKLQISEYKNLPQPKIITQNIPLYSYIYHNIKSPINGTFLKGVETNKSIVKMGDILFWIENHKFWIEAYFSQKNIDYLQKKDIVSILLPDGTKKEGYIKEISFENLRLNSEISQKLKVKIIPLDKNIKFWRKYRFLKIKVRKYKWSL